MALLFADPFDNYTVGSQVWDTVSNAFTYSSSFFRFPPPAGLTGQGVEITSQGAFQKKNLPANAVTLLIHVAWNFKSFPSSGPSVFLDLEDNGTVQVSVAIMPNGSIQFYRGPFSALVAIGSPSPPGSITMGWHHLQILVTIDPSAGVVTCYLDGGASPIINSSGLNTRTSANSYANQLLIGDRSSNGVRFHQADDLVVFDTTGARDNALLGDIRLITKMPSGAGDLTQWTKNGVPATNFGCCNEIPPDDDTTYVSSSTPGQIDTYAMQSAGLAAAPFFFVVRQRIRKDDTGVHTFQGGARSGGVNGFGAAVTVPSSYTFIDTAIPNDPLTSAPWTAAGADAAQVAKNEVS